MTTQTARKGEAGHVPEDRERLGRTPKTRRVSSTELWGSKRFPRWSTQLARGPGEQNPMKPARVGP